MGLSSNTIIHFTKNFSNLKGILEKNFKVSYCREKIMSGTKHVDFLVPMVSFCDIPFSQILSHISNYGSYGIGLKKVWAENKGLNPVLYIEKNSILSGSILNDLLKLLRNGKNTISELDENGRKAYDIVRYLKNYEADLQRNHGRILENYRFSDEREWRYVIDPINDHKLLANIKGVDVEEVKSIKKNYNDLVKHYTLDFTPEDINYIIIKSEYERDDVIRLLETVKGKYSHEEVKRLTSRVISVEQLKTDF